MGHDLVQHIFFWNRDMHLMLNTNGPSIRGPAARLQQYRRTSLRIPSAPVEVASLQSCSMIWPLELWLSSSPLSWSVSLAWVLQTAPAPGDTRQSKIRKNDTTPHGAQGIREAALMKATAFSTFFLAVTHRVCSRCFQASLQDGLLFLYFFFFDSQCVHCLCPLCPVLPLDFGADGFSHRACCVQATVGIAGIRAVPVVASSVSSFLATRSLDQAQVFHATVFPISPSTRTSAGLPLHVHRHSLVRSST